MSRLTMKELAFKVEARIRRLYIRYSSDPRPSSYPYLSSDSFRKAADHIYDETTQKFLPLNIRHGDIVFVRHAFLHEFFLKIHPQILYPYILLSHINDDSMDGAWLPLIDDKIIKWYAQNVAVYHPKLVPLPIGLQNLYNYDYGITSIYQKLHHRSVHKKNKILFGFSMGEKHNYEERLSAFKALSHNPNTVQIKNRMVQISYLSLLNEHAFVASPSGRGIDCHRTWEALYVKTIPIVRKSILTEYFYDQGMPLWMIDDWQEVSSVSEEQLARIYEDLAKRFDNQTEFMDFWMKKIRSASR